jgi:hypothetical protein
LAERIMAERELQDVLAEVDRRQRLVLALSRAAQAVQLAHQSQDVYRTIGEQISNLELQAIIFVLNAERARLDLAHLTIPPARLAEIEVELGLAVCLSKCSRRAGRASTGRSPMLSYPAHTPNMGW